MSLTLVSFAIVSATALALSAAATPEPAPVSAPVAVVQAKTLSATAKIREKIRGYVPVDAPKFSASQALPGPNDLTWDEVPTESSGTGEFRQTPKLQAASAAVTPAAAKAGPACRVNTGNVYKRSSGKKFPYGTVGGHPTTVCTTPMVIIKHTTTMYKTTWWGLQHQGNFVGIGSAFGAKRYEQKNVAVICKDLRETTFKMVVASSGTQVGGGSSGAWAYEMGEKLKCGTP